MSGSPTKFNRSSLVVLALLLCAAGLFLFLEKQKHKKNVESAIAAAQAPTQQMMTQAAAPDADEGDADDVDDNDDDEAEDRPVRIVNCETEAAPPSIRISHERFLTLLREKYVWEAISGSQACYKKGQSTNVLVFRAENKIVYELTSRGKALVEEIEEMPFADLKGNTKFLLTDAEEKGLRRGLRRRARRTGEKFKDMKVKVVRLKAESWFESKKTYGAPFLHPMARTLDLNEFKAAIAEGKIVYDVRPEEMFKIKTVTGAASMPVGKFDRNQFVLQSPTRLKELAFSMDLTKLPQQKNHPMIIFSSCGGDFLSYNAITYLRGLGYRKIQWFRGGLENWMNGAGCGTPEKVEGIPQVGIEEVQKRLRDKAIPLFVQEGTSLRPYKIPGSRTLDYHQKYLGDAMPAFRKTNFSLAEFEASGDETDIEALDLPKEATIIVYGRYDFDWRSLKVAQLLKLKGYHSVFWYRMGLDDWLNHALFRPQDFPTTPEFVRE